MSARGVSSHEAHDDPASEPRDDREERLHRGGVSLRGTRLNGAALISIVSSSTMVDIDTLSRIIAWSAG